MVLLLISLIRLGVVQIDLSHEEDQIMEIALDAGADDFNADGRLF